MDAAESPAFTVMESSAELLYLLKFDSRGIFGSKDPLEESKVHQWLFFWHGSGAPYQGNLSFFRKAQEQNPCKSLAWIHNHLLLT
jgi:glutathione S-transferase